MPEHAGGYSQLALARTSALRQPAGGVLPLQVTLAVLLVGVRLHWRWLFWLLLIAFGAMILDIPATILQLTGVVPSLFPVWYSLCRMGVSLLAVIIAAWMLSIYRHYGVWALGKKKKPHLEG